MTTNLFARAYVHGLNADLVAAGTVVYPSKIAMDIAATSVADHVLKDVNFLALPNGMPTKLASDTIGALIRVSDDLVKKAGGYSPELSKVASAADGLELARHEAFELLKIAEAEAMNPESTNSAQTTLDLGTGKVPEAPEKKDGADGIPGPAVVGDEHAVGQGTTPASAKLASDARRLAAKIAATDGKNPEKTNATSKDVRSATGTAAVAPEKKDGAEGIPASAEIGAEAAQKTASYHARVEKVAAAVIPYLPPNIPAYAQLAHVRQLSKLASLEQGKYLYSMYGAYGYTEPEALEFAQAYVKRAEDLEIDEKVEDDDSPVDDGSSAAAVSAALSDAADEIEEAKKEEDAADAAKIASAEKLKRVVGPTT